ncbi:hypothetical protein BGW41_005029 [Actinomortierella wolfii]|nr:hypothetical protein BGW41_005029 [Actinomortierella wolfii]
MSQNPFELAEIRKRVSRYTSVKTSLSCIRVSKAFYEDFVRVIWHSIDFEVHGKFADLSHSVLSKNGHHVREVRNIKSQKHINTLQSFGTSKISTVCLRMSNDAAMQAGYYDLIRRNCTTLTLLEISSAGGVNRTTSPFIFLDSLTSMNPSSSKLTKLTLRWIIITRESLISGLRCCPALTSIDLWGATITPSRALDEYQHMGVTLLQAMIPDVINANPPLLVHFPKLERWDLGDDSKPNEFPTATLKDSIAIWCPKLKKIETNFTPRSLLSHLLANVFVGLTSLTLNYAEFSPEVILAILRYPANWKLITTMIYHKADLDEIEATPWLCANLQHLTMRIQGYKDCVESALHGTDLKDFLFIRLYDNTIPTKDDNVNLCRPICDS